MSAEAEILPFDHSAPVPEAPAAPAPLEAERLRFLVCGSVDDGKSTLIGRLLWDTKSVPEDHRAALLAKGSRQNDLELPDFALLLDGLKAEQEQGITIDVAYRYFQTARRAFIVADTPGHQQYTRNMATGASTADLAVLLVDARAGLLEQTRRHATICHLMGIRQMVLAINKIDLVGYDRAVFERITADFQYYAAQLGGIAITAIPVSALKGENVVARAHGTMDWYRGPTLIEALEFAEGRRPSTLPFRMPIQRVSRPSGEFRGYQGTIAAGVIAVGDRVSVHPSGEIVSISRIVTFDGDRVRAGAGEAVTLVFDRHTDAARGDVLTLPDAAPLRARSFTAKVISLQGAGLTSGDRLWIKSGARMRRAVVDVRSSLDLPTGEWLRDDALPVNAIGEVTLRFEEEAIFDRFDECAGLGAFVMVSPQDNNTVAGGMITGLAEGAETGVARVTLSVPADLVEAILASPAVAGRAHEIRVLGH